MKKRSVYILFALCTAALAAGCAADKRARGLYAEVIPSSVVLTPDSTGNAAVNVTLRISGECFSRRSRLFLRPELMAGNRVLEVYPPLVLDGPVYARQMERLRVLKGHEDPYAGSAQRVRHAREYTVPFRTTIRLPQDGSANRLVAVLSTEGCGGCPGRDTVEIAGVADPMTLAGDMTSSLKWVWLEPAFEIRPKTREGRGVARLQFAINASDIRLDRGDNRTEMERMLAELGAAAKDTLSTLDKIIITGSASADGPLPSNTALARRRALAARDWLAARFPDPQAARRLFSVASYPEGWTPVLAAMTAAGDPDSLALKAILETYDGDDVQESHIRRLPAWNRIKEHYLPRERKVEYYYAYTVRSFTDDGELLTLYALRPDAFSEAELLRVAALTNDPAAKRGVYETLLRYYPQSQPARNNLAVLLLRDGRGDEAATLLEGVDDASSEVLNTLGTAYFTQGDNEKAAAAFQQSGTPEARYNLGLVRARQRRLAEAYELLQPFGDLNAALAALSLGRNAEAAQLLAASDDTSPAAEYARAIVAARRNDDKAVYLHLASAGSDETLRHRAAAEADFAKYRNDARFAAFTDNGKGR